MYVIFCLFKAFRPMKLGIRLTSPVCHVTYPSAARSIITSKGEKTLLKSEPHHLYHIYWSLWRQLSWKKCLLVICTVLKIFLNILTGDDKYFLVNRDNLRQPIQMQLSQKQKTSSEFVSVFFKFISNFEHFLKEEDPHSWCISESTDSEKRG